MMAVLRYVGSMLFCTLYHASRVLLATRRGEPHVAGGLYDRIPREYGRDLLRVNRVPVRATGLDKLQGLGPCVYASNHESWFDIPALVTTLPGSVRFLAKKELGKVPLFGRAMRLTGHITVDRDNPDAAHAAYAAAAHAIPGGISAVVFAEGTRTRDGKLRPFKKGPFVLAILAQAPVVPVYVEGGYRILRRGSLRPRPGTMTVHIGEPIATTGLRYDDRDALAARVRAAIIGLGAKE
jgi:1-acyl-sn-glycerol-3-phosphate acyltransferase